MIDDEKTECEARDLTVNLKLGLYTNSKRNNGLMLPRHVASLIAFESIHPVVSEIAGMNHKSLNRS